MDLPSETKEWSGSDLRYFTPGERKGVVIRKLENDERLESETLYTKEHWDKWFSYAPGISPALEELQPGLYIVLCSRAAPVFDKQAPVSYLPFTSNTWERLAREFHIPQEIKRTISREVACFTSLRQHDRTSNRLKMAFTARMAETLPNDLALSTTYIPSTGSTFAIVYGCTEKQMDDIKNRIDNADEQLQHPLLMVGVFMELERKRLVGAVDDLLDSFTLRSDHLESTPWGPESDKDGKETQKYLTLCLQSRNLMDHIRAVKRQISKLMEEIDEVAEELRSLGPEDWQPLSDAGRETLAKVGVKMKRRVQDIDREYDDKIDDCNMVICNTSLAMQAVWNHIARQDSNTNVEISKANAVIALQTKHESAQMRSIAILTMIYLPLSSVAAIFSMDMFNWEANDGESIVSKHIWLFALLSVALTLLTLAAWRLGTRRDKKLVEKSNRYFRAPERQNSIV